MAVAELLVWGNCDRLICVVLPPMVILVLEVLLLRSASLKPVAPDIEILSEMVAPCAAIPWNKKVTLPTIPKEKLALLGTPAPLAAGQLELVVAMQDQRILLKPLNVAVKLALVATVEPRLVTVTTKLPSPPEADAVFWVMAMSGKPSVKYAS